jgi:hypothetical protein
MKTLVSPYSTLYLSLRCYEGKSGKPPQCTVFITGNHFGHWKSIVLSFKSMPLFLQGRLFSKSTVGHFSYIMAWEYL